MGKFVERFEGDIEAFHDKWMTQKATVLCMNAMLHAMLPIVLDVC